MDLVIAFFQAVSLAGDAMFVLSAYIVQFVVDLDLALQLKVLHQLLEVVLLLL